MADNQQLPAESVADDDVPILTVEQIDDINDEWCVPNRDLSMGEAWDIIRPLLDAVYAYRDVAIALADALRFHEDRRANPTSRGGPALARFDALIDGSIRPESRACMEGRHDECRGVNNGGATCTCAHHDGRERRCLNRERK